MKVIIAQCTDEKKSGKHRAKELYMPSDYFKGQRRYCEAYADEWWILSAKYGLIRPNKFIKSYDRHIKEGFPALAAEPIQEKHDRIFDRYDEDVTVELICGRDYAERLVWYLDHYDIEYTKPFKGMGIATRTKEMIKEARKQENNNLLSYA